jgi:hypothetical protein
LVAGTWTSRSPRCHEVEGGRRKKEEMISRRRKEKKRKEKKGKEFG